jgi:diguanylate cyclase (GGDEF)-like protein
MKVLIVEDAADSRLLLERTLKRWGYEVVVTTNGEEAWEILQQENHPKLILLDWMMPGMDGLEITRKIRENHHGGEYDYIIMVTGKRDQKDIVTGMETGADDYVIKPFHPAELKARIRAAMRILRLQETLLENQQQLKDKSITDALTGIWNRGGIMDILDKEIERYSRSNESVGIIMADIDHFKSVNDNYGHLVGDAVLMETARRIADTLRKYDAVGRFGGEEFICVIPGCDLTTTAEVAERIHSAIVGKPFNTSEGSLDVTISLGVSNNESNGITDKEKLIKLADDALYRAKDNGRNRVELMIL